MVDNTSKSVAYHFLSQSRRLPPLQVVSNSKLVSVKASIDNGRDYNN